MNKYVMLSDNAENVNEYQRLLSDLSAAVYKTDPVDSHATRAMDLPAPELKEIFNDCNGEGCADFDEETRLVGLDSSIKGKKFALVKKRVSVGSSSSNDIILNSQFLSPFHAHFTRINQEGTRWFLVDDSSINGTFVNGKKIKKKALSAGDCLMFGDIKLEFQDNEVSNIYSPGGAVAPRGYYRRRKSSKKIKKMGIIFGGGALIAYTLFIFIWIFNQQVG
jgi:pSer/pThr/pTyr-binding forkhead associated (FHA) protein